MNISQKVYEHMTKIEKDYNIKCISAFITGSRLYGTSTENSDYDIRGVFIANKNQYLGFLNTVEILNYDDKENNIDYEFMEIKKFLQLCLNGNPNIVEYLFINNQNVLYTTLEWKKILSNKKHFLSKKAKHTFTGYAISQVKRIKTHRNWLLNPPKKKPERKDYGLPESHKLITTEQIGAYNRLVCNYLKQVGKFHELRNKLEKMEETIDYMSVLTQVDKLDISSVNEIYPTNINFMESLDREKKYNQAMREFTNYQNWKKQRNPRRKILEKNYGFDTKHMQHCFRLLGEGKELLEKGYITFPHPNKDYLLEILNGVYQYDELIVKVDNIEEQFGEFYNNSILPKQPNRKEIESVCIDILGETIS